MINIFNSEYIEQNVNYFLNQLCGLFLRYSTEIDFST